MLKNKLTIKFYAIILVVVWCVAVQMAIPPPPYMWANTGSTGEVTCFNCHNLYRLNAPGGYLKISTVPPINNSTYIPGQNYLVTESFTRPPLTTYQCSTEIIDSLGNNAGAMAVSDSVNTYMETAPSGRFCLWAGYYNLDTVIYCNFLWTAPLSGRVSIYAAGVARTNLIGGADGYVSTDSIVNLQPGTVTRLPGVQSEKTITLYPNPVQNLLHVKILGEEKLLRYSITNLSGQLVKRGNTGNGLIDLSDLAAGPYLLECFTGAGKMQPTPFIKQ